MNYDPETKSKRSANESLRKGLFQLYEVTKVTCNNKCPVKNAILKWLQTKDEYITSYYNDANYTLNGKRTRGCILVKPDVESDFKDTDAKLEDFFKNINT